MSFLPLDLFKENCGAFSVLADIENSEIFLTSSVSCITQAVSFHIAKISKHEMTWDS